MPFVDTAEMEPRSPKRGWRGRFVHSEHMTFVFWDIEDGAEGLHEHHHEQEEVWNVLEGEIDVTIAGVTRTVGAGTVAIVPSGTAHSVRVNGPARVLVVDYPTRAAFGDPSIG
jgi:unsaturated pyranuronate lyase